MKTFLVISALIAVAVARSAYNDQHQEYESHQGQQQQRRQIPIVKFESEQNPHGYRYGYEAGNGIQVVEQGQVKKLSEKDQAVVSEGFYTFRGDDGKDYTIQYIADENGFRAAGDHLPTPVPLPEENKKLIAEAYARPTSTYDLEEEKNGSYERAQPKQYRAQQQQQYQYQH